MTCSETWVMKARSRVLHWQAIAEDPNNPPVFIQTSLQIIDRNIPPAATVNRPPSSATALAVGLREPLVRAKRYQLVLAVQPHNAKAKISIWLEENGSRRDLLTGALCNFGTWTITTWR